MPRPLKFIIVLAVLVGLVWFSNYAYHEVDKSDNSRLAAENKKLTEQVVNFPKQMASQHGQFKADLAKKYEILLVMFPNDAERINALFNPKLPAPAADPKAAAEESTKPSETETAKPAEIKDGH